MTTVVLLPGMDGTGELFSEFVSALGGACSVVVGSYPRDRCLSFDELVEHAASFLPRAGRFVLLAESFSGPVGVTLAERHHDRLDALVLCATFVVPPVPMLSVVSRLASLVPPSSIPQGLLSLALLGPWRTAALGRQIKRAVSSVDTKVLASRIEVLSSCDVSRSLERIQAPVLNLCAGNDRLVRGWCADRIEMLCGHAERVVLAGTHCLLQACPSEAAAAG